MKGYYFKKILFIVPAIFLTTNIAFAGEQVSQNQYKGLQKKAETQKKEIIQNALEKTELIDRLDKLDQKLANATVKFYKTESNIKRLSRKIVSISKQRKSTNIEYRILFEKFKKRIKAYYMYSDAVLFPFFILNKDDNPVFLERGMESIIRHDQRLYDNLMKKAIELDQIKKEYQKQDAALKILKSKQKEIIKNVEQEKNQRLAMLVALRQREEDYYAVLLQINAAKESMQFKIRDNNQKIKNNFSFKNSFGENFANKKGMLQMPLKGKIVSKFGRAFKGNLKAAIFNKGINISGRSNSRIKAIANGNVEFSGWIKGYGNVIIINHGNGYFTLSAHIAMPYKKTGDIVNFGEIIGLLGSMGTDTTDTLYFELRKDGKAINPLKWFSVSN